MRKTRSLWLRVGVLVASVNVLLADAWDDRMQAAREAFRNGRFADAEAEYRRALDAAGPADPRRARALHDLGFACYRLGRLGEAESCYRRAEELWTSAGGFERDLAANLN